MIQQSKYPIRTSQLMESGNSSRSAPTGTEINEVFVEPLMDLESGTPSTPNDKIISEESIKKSNWSTWRPAFYRNKSVWQFMRGKSNGPILSQLFIGLLIGLPVGVFVGFSVGQVVYVYHGRQVANPKYLDPRERAVFIVGAFVIPSILAFLILTLVIRLLVRNARLSALAEIYQIEEGLLNRGPQNFKFSVLSTATKGFSSLLGSGGFGSVYKGSLVLQEDTRTTEIAVKRISATSDQGAKEFLAEVKIIGQAQHRNVVRLLGWCHERGELLLVYDYMPNGSLDQHLYSNSQGETVLTWSRRLKIVSGIATALAYLHEEWEQRVIHRDVKSSNVMLDRDFNARLGDFGLARLSEHDQAPPSTAVLAGTFGYMAPELVQTLKPTEKTDVYSFGATLLEVATGKKPWLSKEDSKYLNEVLLVDWVWSLNRNDVLLEAADFTLHNAYHPGEMTMFLKLGLLCCHPNPEERPTMREVINIWKGSSLFPSLPRSKPVPVFPSSKGLEFSTDGDSDSNLLIVIKNYGDGALSGTQTFAFDNNGHSTLKTAAEDRAAEDGGATLPPAASKEGTSFPHLTLRQRHTTTSLPF